MTEMCECPRCGRMHHRLAAHPPEAVASQAMKAVEALRTPDASMRTVANTVRQSIADVIEAQKRKTDRYALALMMIREGCDDPAGFAKEMLREWKCPASATADPPTDCAWPMCGCDPIANKVLDSISYLIDPPVCRLQFPDGHVPGNAAHAAEGWKRWADIFLARLRMIADVAEGSETANSLPHIAKIARGSI